MHLLLLPKQPHITRIACFCTLDSKLHLDVDVEKVQVLDNFWLNWIRFYRCAATPEWMTTLILLQRIPPPNSRTNNRKSNRRKHNGVNFRGLDHLVWPTFYGIFTVLVLAFYTHSNDIKGNRFGREKKLNRISSISLVPQYSYMSLYCILTEGKKSLGLVF